MPEAPVQHSLAQPYQHREIIDVDEVFENNGGAHPGPSRGPVRPLRAPHSQVIILDDSDDEIQEVPHPQQRHNAHDRNPTQPRPRIIRRDREPAPYLIRHTFPHIFSPSPPPPQVHPIPPVPPIPAGINVFRPRPRAAPDYAGVLLPMDGPHPIEALLETGPPVPQPQHMPPNIEVPPPRGQPRRTNNMGLGGAFLSLNRRNEWEQVQRIPERGRDGADWHIPGWEAVNYGFNTLRRMFGAQQVDDMDPGVREALQMIGEEAQNNNDMQYPRFNGHLPDRLRPAAERLAQRQAQEKEQADYKPCFTHPINVDHGFSNDFAPQETSSYESVSSSSSSNEGSSTVLVCAGCREPLVMNVTGPEDIIRTTKLWALRCGHILDGRCIEQIMKPPPPAPPPCEVDPPSSFILAKLHEAAGNFVDPNDSASLNINGKRIAEGFDELQAPTTQSDRKGKGRAYPAIPLPSVAIPAANTNEAASSSMIADTPLDSMRSRLRPRLSATPHNHDIPLIQQTAVETLPSETAQPQPVQEEQPLVSTRRRGRGRGARGRSSGKGKGSRKGKAKPKPVVIEAEHVWRCPVASCQREHKSHLIEGQWRMAEGEGAIAMYV